MIDPFTAFAALKGATEAISSGIKTGKDLINMSGLLQMGKGRGKSTSYIK